MSGESLHPTLTLHTLSDKRGYFYKVRSYCDLWRWHEFEFMFRNGHPYNNRLPEIIEVGDNEEDLDRHYEILYNILNLDVHKRTKYDVVTRVTKTTGDVPDLGMELFELTDFYHCGDLTRGLFVYNVQFDSAAYKAGLQEGDVIVSAMRPEVERKPSSLWDRNTYHVTCPDPYTCHIIKQEKGFKTYGISSVSELMKMFSWCRNNERVIFNIVRDNVEMSVEIIVPFRTVVIKRFDIPRIVVKTIPRFEVKDNSLRMNYVKVWNETNQVANENMNDLFLGLTCDIDDTGNLVMDIPDNLNEVDFYITKDGNLAARYD